MNESIEERTRNIREKIESSCEKSGRRPAGVTLVAVSKLKPVADLIEAVQAGNLDLGENYVQEWSEKVRAWPAGILEPRWHLIGPLQTNKVKLVVGKIHLIHSVDRTELLFEIAKRAAAVGIKQKILIQVKIGNEETKHGAALSSAADLASSAITLPSIELCGLMALPPLTEDEHTARGYFRQVVNARDKWVLKNPLLAPHLRQLSMGTSGDFLWAIEEGATIVRVGSAIFGSRS